MDLSKLQTLKEKMVQAKDFAEVMDYYFDEFANVPAFARIGQPHRDKELFEAVAQVAAQARGKSTSVTQMALFRVPEHRFIHGMLHLGASDVGMVFFFEDVERGMLALGSRDEGPNHFSRFSLVKTPAGKSVLVH